MGSRVPSASETGGSSRRGGKAGLYQRIFRCINVFNQGVLAGIKISPAAVRRCLQALNLTQTEGKLRAQDLPRLARQLAREIPLPPGEGTMRTDKICSALAQLLSLDSEIVANPQEVDLEIFDGALPLTPAQQDEVVGRMVAAMQENKYIQEERDWGREFNRAARSREEGSDRVCDFAKQKMDAASQQAGELRRRLAERMLLWPAAAAKVLPQMMAQERGTLNSTAARVAFIDLLVKAALGQMPAEGTPIEVYLREIVEAAAPDHDPGATTYQARFFRVEVYKAAKAGLQKLGVAFSTQGQVKESTTAGDHSHPNVARWIQDSFVKYFPQTTAVIKKMVEGQPPREASADSMTEIIGLAYKEGDPLSVEASGEDAKLAAKWLVAALSARREDTQPLWAEK